MELLWLHLWSGRRSIRGAAFVFCFGSALLLSRGAVGTAPIASVHGGRLRGGSTDCECDVSVMSYLDAMDGFVAVTCEATFDCYGVHVVSMMRLSCRFQFQSPSWVRCRWRQRGFVDKLAVGDNFFRTTEERCQAPLPRC